MNDQIQDPSGAVHGVTLLSELLADVTPSPAAYISTARRIEAVRPMQLRPVRLTMLSSFTSQILRPYLVVEGARRGLAVVPYFCPFNQFETQAFDGASELYESQPDVIVLALRLEEAMPDIAARHASLSTEQVESELARFRVRIQSLLAEIRRHTDGAILVFNLALPGTADAGFADAILEISQATAIARANDMLAAACRANPGVHSFDYARLVYRFGIDSWHDSKLFYTARIPMSQQAQVVLSREVCRYARAALFPPSKCLVVDLDNTLWGGVLGEEGIGGIALGEDYPGNVFKAFQRRLVSLRDQGVLLAIASKNNEDDVTQAFRTHSDMLLKLEDFAAVQVHWHDKAASMRAIARELNIGLDALAFFDDNPVEREWVTQNVPEVTVIAVPSDPTHYIQALEDSGAFDRLVISNEDRRRAAMTREVRQRNQLRAESTSVSEFLRSLNMVATVGVLSPATLPRISQLLNKTNQFNLTTRRHSAAQLEQIVNNGGLALWLRLADQFGDNGLVGVAIAVPTEDDGWHVDSFLMSCRVIGRHVETALLGILARQLARRGAKRLIGEFIPTQKNAQVAGFYSAHGFQSMDADGHLWALNLTEQRIDVPEFILIECADEELNG